MRAYLITGLVLFLCLHANAQVTSFHGTISDEQGRPLPFVSVWINHTDTGTATNELGFYYLNLKPGFYSISFRIPGYVPVSQNIRVKTTAIENNLHLRTIETSNQPTEAGPVIWHTINRHNSYPDELPDYEGRLYIKKKQELYNFPQLFLKKDIAHQFHLSPDHKGIINLSESILNYHTRKADYIKEDLIASKLTADSNFFGFAGAGGTHIDLYQNTLLLNGFCDHQFLSPIADNAPHFYYYNITGTFTDGGKKIYAVKVQPKDKNEHLFNGTIYIVDKEWLLYGVDLYLRGNAHVNFIDSISIRQQFVPLNDSTWVPGVSSLQFGGKMLGFKYAAYSLRLYQSIHNDTSVNPGLPKEVYQGSKEDYEKNDRFWLENRPLMLSPAEQTFYLQARRAQRHKIDKTLTDSIQNSNNSFLTWHYILRGYTLHNYHDNSVWIFPSPVNNFFYNTVEGFGVDLDAKYKKTYTSQHSLTIIPNARYGLADHVFNANVFADYIYNPFRQASVYGKFGSDFLDLNNQGTITPFLNSLSTLFLGDNYIKLYQSKFIMTGTTAEVTNGILLNGQIEYDERHPLFNTTLHTFNKDSVYLTSNNPLDPYGNTPLFPPYRALIFTGSATFTFDQQYKITPEGKFIIPNPYPRVRINYTKGISAFGSDVDYDFVSVDVFQQKLRVGLFGYTGYFLSAGFFPNKKKLYYPDYKQFSGGESFFFNAFLGGFHFLNYYTYSTDKPYFEAHVEHNFAGYFLSRVPLLNRLNLQEIIGGSFLTQGTLPDYKEVYIGLKRTFIRLDYGLAYGRFTKVIQGFRLSFNM